MMSEKDTSYDAVILGDGNFPSSAEALSVLSSARFLCCCDNAGRAYIERFVALEGKRLPDAIVGDGDSLSAEFKEKYADIYHQIDEQEYNDLTKATRFCIEHVKRSGTALRIAYIGTTGKREDHTLGNISLLSFYRKTFGIIPEMITDHGTFTAHGGDVTLPSFPRQQVSIFNLSCKDITSLGLKWDAYAYAELWQGTLNEALAEEFTINADGDFIVYRTHKAKA